VSCFVTHYYRIINCFSTPASADRLLPVLIPRII